MAGGRTIVLGVGNTMLTDDGVGIEIARQIGARMARQGKGGDPDVAEACCAGWRLMDLLSGYDRAILVDAYVGGPGEPGTCYRLDCGDHAALCVQSSHGLGIREAVALARQAGMRMPETLSFYGVEVAEPYAFGEALTPEVAAAVTRVADLIIEEEGLGRP